MIYFIILGLIFTLLLKRNPITVINNVNFRWFYLIIGSFVFQIIIFYLSRETGKHYPYLLEISLFILLIGLYANKSIPGIKLFALGVMINLLAIIVHGGFMPISEKAAVIAGVSSNFSLNDPRHKILKSSFSLIGDVIPFFHHVISIGDLMVGIGLIVFLIKNSSKRVFNER